MMSQFIKFLYDLFNLVNVLSSKLSEKGKKDRKLRLQIRSSKLHQQELSLLFTLALLLNRIICLRHRGQSSKEFRHDKSSIHNHHQEELAASLIHYLTDHCARVSKKINSLVLEPRQYKTDSIQSKIIPTLKLPRFFNTYTVKEKVRQFQNWNYF